MTTSSAAGGEHRVLAPELDPTVKAKGPASYFPSIERTYGRPLQDWLDLVAAELDAGRRHMEVVELLKAEHGVGHGHAQAMVHYTKTHLPD